MKKIKIKSITSAILYVVFTQKIAAQTMEPIAYAPMVINNSIATICTGETQSISIANNSGVINPGYCQMEITKPTAHISNTSIEFAVFPNPASQFLQITTVGIVSEFAIQIFDMQGKIVFEKYNCLTAEKLNLYSLNNGFYLIKFKVNNQSFTEKLIIQK